MKIPFRCIGCADEGVNAEAQVVKMIPMESGLYEVKCNRGHSRLTVLQQMRFEILFEIGVAAIKDGYFREAVSSFAAALERFFEFYIEMVFRERKADSTLRASVWKMIAAQSERQLGAYLFLYALHENEKPVYLSDKNIQFRNAVVHKGRFPTEQEAIDFGNVVMSIINPIVRRLKERGSDNVLHAVIDYSKAVLSVTKQQVTSSLCHNTTISLAYGVSVPDCTDIRDRLNVL